MSLTCADKALRLATLQAALDKLLIGRNVEANGYADKSSRYTPPNISELRREIALAQAAVDACNGVRGDSQRRVAVIPR